MDSEDKEDIIKMIYFLLDNNQKEIDFYKKIMESEVDFYDNLKTKEAKDCLVKINAENAEIIGDLYNDKKYYKEQLKELGTI